jgi:phospholipase C
MSRLSLALFTVLLLFPVTTRAAEQTVLGSKLIVKNPSTPEKRKVLVSAKEVASDDTIVGDPVANGATLTVRMTGGAVDGETYNLPTGTSPTTLKPFWSGDAVKGFKYKDPKGDNGTVSGAKISLKSGKFQVKVKISGKLGTINLVPPNPGADGCATLTLNGGDSYSINFASGTAKNNGATLFMMSKPTAEGTCIRPNPNNLPIDHIVILMQENRSADTYLAQLSNQGQPAYEAEPNTGNPDPTNNANPPILPFHKTTYCEVADLDHSWQGTHAEVDGGLMDGFTARNANALDPTGSRTMGYYDQTDLPFYFGLYNTFATGDRYFSSALTQTFPNRLYLFAATSFGYINNNVSELSFPSIFNLLDQAGITWRVYASQYPSAYSSFLFSYVSARSSIRVFPLAQYFTDLANGTLPNVSFVDPMINGTPKTENDEHPISNVQVGQKFVADVVNGLMTSPVWSTSAMFLAYDEHGGFYDHVVPPAAPVPDSHLPKWGPGDVHALFDQYGVRVPAVVISPYSKAHFVSHVVHDHTSILRFIETRFALPSLTNRDAAADPMLEFFDFTTPAFATPPSLPAAVIDQTQLNACPG